MIPARLSAGEGWSTLVTSTFLHAGFWHLFGNMLFLWIFGDNLEEALGHLGFLVFYLACGVGAGLGAVGGRSRLDDPDRGRLGRHRRGDGRLPLAVPAGQGRHPLDPRLLLPGLHASRPGVMLGIWFALQLFGGFGADASAGGVAYWAHAGGFAIGLVLVLPLWLRRGGPTFWKVTHGHPPHPEARYKLTRSSIPEVRRRR